MSMVTAMPSWARRASSTAPHGVRASQTSSYAHPNWRAAHRKRKIALAPCLPPIAGSWREKFSILNGPVRIRLALIPDEPRIAKGVSGVIIPLYRPDGRGSSRGSLGKRAARHRSSIGFGGGGLPSPRGHAARNRQKPWDTTVAVPFSRIDLNSGSDSSVPRLVQASAVVPPQEE